jgi:mRNA interferase MazF
MLTSGDVVDLGLGVPEGREAGFRHPAVVLTAQDVLDAGPNVIHVAPVTSTVRGSPSELAIDPDAANGLERRSAVQVQHLRSVSTGRVIEVRGNVGTQALAQAREIVAVLLDLPV